MRKARFKIKEIIEEYRRTLSELGIDAEAVILYGSFARGNPRTDSDIDLVIISKDFKRLNLRRRLEVLGIAAARIMQPIEAKGYTPKEIKMKQPASFLREILTTGVKI